MVCSELMSPGFANSDRSANASSTHIPVASVSAFLSTEKHFCKAAISLAEKSAINIVTL